MKHQRVQVWEHPCENVTQAWPLVCIKEPQIIAHKAAKQIQMAEEGYFEYGNFEKQSGELKTKWGTKSKANLT
jgi:hypothetical protein